MVDIGAHIGLFALFVASKLEQVRLICVEPSTESCAALRTNLELHSAASDAHTVCTSLRALHDHFECCMLGSASVGICVCH